MDKQKIIEQIDAISTVEGITDFLDYLGIQESVFRVCTRNGYFHFWTNEEVMKFQKGREPVFVIEPYGKNEWTCHQILW